MGEITGNSEEFVVVNVNVPIDNIVAQLEEAGYVGSDDNISTIAEALVDKWETDLGEDVAELDFLIEAYEDDLEPDEGNEKGHRDWRARQGE